MLRVAFAGTFAASLEEPVRRCLTTPSELIVADEAGIVGRLADIDVLVTLVLTPEMVANATRLKLVQVPGAGPRPDRPLGDASGHYTGKCLRPRNRHRRICDGSNIGPDARVFPP